MNRLNRDPRVSILNALSEGSSQRACERMFGVSNNTVAKLFRDAGDMAIAKSKEIRDLTCERYKLTNFTPSSAPASATFIA